MIIDMNPLTGLQQQRYLQYTVAPRPICFASTMDAAGNVNLSPFSFFNIFSITPPILIFSALKRMRDGTTKHTINNLREIPQVVINVVDYDMVHQVSLASCDFPPGANEFLKAGFTEEASTIIKPPMVKESKVKFECNVNEIKELGDSGGAGALIICEVLRMHIDDSILNENNMIDQQKLELVARLGGDWYARINSSNLFQIRKPDTEVGIGVDQLPVGIRQSGVLTGNNLAQLANAHEIPAIDPSFSDETLKNIFQYYSINPDDMETELHVYAKTLLDSGKVAEAWQVLLAVN
jgi:flavin reductase (DIM6/NTAB) family NADH-FMN oxidoreductase RutF